MSPMGCATRSLQEDVREESVEIPFYLCEMRELLCIINKGKRDISEYGVRILARERVREDGKK
jgi:hypothetical protein